MVAGQKLGSKWAHMRPAAIAGASGGFASLALHLLRESAFGPELSPSISLPSCDCPDLSLPGTWDLQTLVAGILIGLALGPLLECLVLARQLLALQLRGYVTRLAARGNYRILA